ncbi:hypothetical protein [uncultured Fluviicola sp.]|uniref:hypothetical protein n=1 Tax=uncultured Fluviicola sp. TaxID=463303 RepID=UPI0025D05DAF|nr:hypothetical protein [uncultured Fluviicola sp.]
MKIWRTCIFLLILSACNSPEPAKTVSFETVDEIKKEDAVEYAAKEQEIGTFVLPNEVVVLSFKTKKKKQVFLCRDKDNRYLVYRFGSKSKVELQFPGKLDETSFQKFEYSSYFRGGGVENLAMNLDYLSFTNSGYRYVIYKTYASESVGYEDEVGIRVIHLKTQKETSIEGDFNTFEGGFPEEVMEKVTQSETLYD